MVILIEDLSRVLLKGLSTSRGKEYGESVLETNYGTIMAIGQMCDRRYGKDITRKIIQNKGYGKDITRKIIQISGYGKDITENYPKQRIWQGYYQKNNQNRGKVFSPRVETNYGTTISLSWLPRF